MVHIVQLPQGRTALIREADEVPERLRRSYLEAQARMLKESGANISADGKYDTDNLDVVAMGTSIGPVRDALILAYTKSWDLKDPDAGGDLPLNLESVMDLPGATYDALHEACQAAYTDGKGGQVDTSINPDPASPIEPLVE